jgi:N-acetylneuraminic acid mutarotase
MPQGGRQEVGVAHLDGKIYVIGGLAGGESARVDVYDIAGDQWSEAAPLPSARHHVGAAALGGFVYAIGGLQTASFTPTNEVLRYSPGDDEWVAVAPLPTARGALAVAVANGRIHAVAGMNERGLGVRDHAAYIAEENRWVTLADYPLAREHISAATVDGTIYVMGGRSPLDRNAHRWLPEQGIWVPLPQMEVARAGHAAAAMEGRLVVFGGEGSTSQANSRGVFPQVEVYDPATNRWTKIDDMAVPRHGIAAVTVGNRIYVPGGADVIGFGQVDTNDALEIDF